MRFDDAAESYDAHAQIQRQVAAWCAEWLPQSSSTGPLDVLELGAGTGLMTRHLVAQPHLRVVATDNVPQMLRRGSEQVPEASWQLVDAWKPLAPASDLLVSTSLLQWATDPVAVLRNWRSLVLPNGRLLATWFVRGSLYELSDAAPQLAGLKWHCEKEWLRFLRQANWTVLRSSAWSTVQRFASGAIALRSIHRTGAVLTPRTPTSELRRALRAYEAKYRDEAGQVPLSWRAFRVEATPKKS